VVEGVLPRIHTLRSLSKKWCYMMDIPLERKEQSTDMIRRASGSETDTASLLNDGKKGSHQERRR
jgi:hypothetical protein